MDKWTFVFSPPRVILKVLTWCIVITILINSITLTYFIIDILIIIMSINVSSKRILTSTLRAYISTASASILL